MLRTPCTHSLLPQARRRANGFSHIATRSWILSRTRAALPSSVSLSVPPLAPHQRASASRSNLVEDPIEQCSSFCGMASSSAVLALLRAYRPSLASPEEKAAFAVHLVMLASGFELVASGEHAEAATSSGSGLSTASQENQDPLRGWNATQGAYSFLYAMPPPPEPKTTEASSQLPQGPGQATVKCLAVPDVMLVDACTVGPEGTGGSEGGAGARDVALVHLEFRPAEYVAEAGEPGTSGATVGSYSAVYRNLDRLVGLVSQSICVPLLRSQAGGAAPASGTSTEDRAGSAQAADTAAPGRGPDAGGVAAPEPVHPRGGPRPGIVYPPLPDTPGFGDDLGPGGGAGIMPPRGPHFPGSGMLVGPNDPRWGTVRPGPGLENPDGFTDDGAGPFARPRNVPPGARFDPFGPPGVPGFEPDRFGESRGRRGPPGFNSDLQFFP